MPATEPATPRTLSGFELVRRLGGGGMGEVFEAIRLGPGGFRKRVAIKRLSIDAGGDAASRLLHEARVSARFEHANIVRVLDVAVVNKRPIVVLELLQGHDLQELIGASPSGMPDDIVLAIAEQALEGLSYIHELPDEHGENLGLVHRDLTPRNVFVCDDGCVKILDFGIAKSRSSPQSPQTISGQILGTAEFLSPEQWERLELDGRSDVFQLGSVLYYALSNELPFGRGEILALRERASTATVRQLADVCPVGQELSDFVHRAMRRNRDDRFPTARAMLDALAPMLIGTRHQRKLRVADWLATTDFPKSPQPPADSVPRTIDTGDNAQYVSGETPAEPMGDDDILLAGLPERFSGKRIIGEGGMGIVVEAYDRTLDREVALKLLPSGIGTTVEGGERFLTEAQAAAKLRHPAIVTVYDMDPAAGYIVMELVRGDSLADKLSGDQTLPASEIRAIGATLASALTTAHEHGIIHRDIKPSNILFDDTSVRLADFGVALVGARDPDAGQPVGTPGYMAPEQHRGASVDSRADIYGLGATLYEAATGSRPPADASTETVVTTIADATGDERLASTIARAIEHDPDHRFATAAELGAALAPPRSRWPRGKTLAALIALTVAAAFSGTLAIMRSNNRAATPDAPRVIAFMPFVVSASSPELAFARDGLPYVLADELRRKSGLEIIDLYRLQSHVGDDKAPQIHWLQHAAKLGATHVIRGQIADGPAGIDLSIRVETVEGDPVASLSYRAPVTGVIATARAASGDVIHAISGRRPETVPTRAPLDFDAERNLLAGIQAMFRHKLPDAKNHLLATLASEPNLAEAHYYLTIVLWWMSAPIDECLAHADKALAGPISEEQRDFLHALRLVLDVQYPEAIHKFAEVSERHPNSRDILFGHFEALFHGGRPGEALLVYDRLLRLEPGFRLGFLHPLTYSIARADSTRMQWALHRAEQFGYEQSHSWALRVLFAQRNYAGTLAMGGELYNQAVTDSPDAALANVVNSILAHVHATEGRLEVARSIVARHVHEYPASIMGLAAAAGDRKEIAKANAAATRFSLTLTTPWSRASHLTRVITANVLHADRDTLLAMTAKLEDSTSPRAMRALNQQVTLALVGVALNDDARITAAVASPFIEASAIGLAWRAEQVGDMTAAAAHWQRALGAVGDDHFGIIEAYHLARVQRRAKRPKQVLAACDLVLRPRLFDWSWGGAAGPCMLWSAEAQLALGHDPRPQLTKLRQMRQKAPADDELLVAAGLLERRLDSTSTLPTPEPSP